MNGKTAKLIRKFAMSSNSFVRDVSGRLYLDTRSIKRGWLSTPRNQRWMNRKAMEQELE